MDASEYIPPEIIDEILLRLPVKSLLKFKCVCRSWLSLISSSKFIKTHLNYSTNSKNYANHKVILSSDIPKTLCSTFTCSLSSILDSSALVNPTPLYYPTLGLGPATFRWIYGNCNGLLCIHVHSKLLLYNPTTRKSKILPQSGSYFLGKNYSYGLCYHELDDDYRVVECNNSRVNEVKIYSLRSNSWRKINHPVGTTTHNASITTSPGLPVGGVLHWPIRRNHIRVRLILAVDTGTYTPTTLAAPKYDDARQLIRWGLMVFGGCLGVYYDFRDGVDIWTMKESWTKVLTVPYFSGPMDDIVPRVVLKDGDILLVTDPGYSMVYKPRRNTFIKQVIPDLYVTHLAPSPVFIESLVSPSFDGE